MRIQITATINALTEENSSIDGQQDLMLIQIDNMQTALESPNLNSESYQVLEKRTKELRIPVAKAHCIAYEAIASANMTNIAELEVLPQSSDGVLDTEEYNTEIERLEEQNRIITSSQLGLGQFGSSYNWLTNGYDRLVNFNLGIIKDLRKHIQSAYDYCVLSATIYSTAEQEVLQMLGGSTNSVQSFLATGNPHPMFWAAKVEESFSIAIDSRHDRLALQLSRDNPDKMFLSSDNQSIYYNGQRWIIYDGDNGVLHEAMTPVYKTIDAQIFTYEEFNLGRFLAELGSSSSGATFDYGRGALRRRTEPSINPGAARAAGSVSLVTGTIDAAVAAKETNVIVFRFQESGETGRRVQILVKDERYTGSHSIAAAGIVGSSYAKKVYFAYTGKDITLSPTIMYNIHYEFDPGRELDNSLTKIYYFNNEGNLEFSLRRFPQDKVTLVASGERIDITNASFLGARGSASAYFQDRIIENLEGAGS